MIKEKKRILPPKKQKKGFTLIEVIIVFALIGILVGLGLPQYKNATNRAREATLKENLYILRQLIRQSKPSLTGICTSVIILCRISNSI